jgi:hypothetical protein
MKYSSPLLQPAGTASNLIQAKVESGTDNQLPNKLTALSTSLEAE